MILTQNLTVSASQSRASWARNRADCRKSTPTAGSRLYYRGAVGCPRSRPLPDTASVSTDQNTRRGKRDTVTLILLHGRLKGYGTVDTGSHHLMLEREVVLPWREFLDWRCELWMGLPLPGNIEISAYSGMDYIAVALGSENLVPILTMSYYVRIIVLRCVHRRLPWPGNNEIVAKSGIGYRAVAFGSHFLVPVLTMSYHVRIFVWRYAH